jgi:hypothetical protein
MGWPTRASSSGRQVESANSHVGVLHRQAVSWRGLQGKLNDPTSREPTHEPARQRNFEKGDKLVPNGDRHDANAV